MDADLRFAHELADVADAITLARFRASDLRVDTKPDLTPVSEADRAAEEAIRARVSASGRGEGVLGEEFGDDDGDAKWIVDPIDGTTNYVRGVPVWATLLALEREGEVALGLVSAAYMAETIRAGIEAVPRGQMEAARTLGMSHGRAITRSSSTSALDNLSDDETQLLTSPGDRAYRHFAGFLGARPLRRRELCGRRR